MKNTAVTEFIDIYDYELETNPRRKRISIKIQNGKLIVSTPPFVSKSRLNSFIKANEDWIVKNLLKSRQTISNKNYHPPLSQAELNEITNKALIILKPIIQKWIVETKINPKKITIRAMKSKWGSARSNGNITFNSLLIQLEPSLIDAVIVHELCHLKQMNHSKSFYDLCCKFLPKYIELDKTIDEVGYKILRKLTGYYE